MSPGFSSQWNSNQPLWNTYTFPRTSLHYQSHASYTYCAGHTAVSKSIDFCILYSVRYTRFEIWKHGGLYKCCPCNLQCVFVCRSIIVILKSQWKQAHGNGVNFVLRFISRGGRSLKTKHWLCFVVKAKTCFFFLFSFFCLAIANWMFVKLEHSKSFS